MARRRLECPHCGESFREGRTSCPHCGADAETGWLSKEDQELAALDTSFTHLEEGDYELFLRSEGLEETLGRVESKGRRPRLRPASSGGFPVIPLILLALLALTALLRSLLG